MADSSNWELTDVLDAQQQWLPQIHLLPNPCLPSGQYSKSWQEAEDRTKQDVDMSIATTSPLQREPQAITELLISDCNFRWTLNYAALK